MLEGPIASVRHKLDIALKTMIGAIVALAAVIVAIGFFCAAAFLWIDARRGAIIASLVLGGAFLLLALIALLVVFLLQRRKPPPVARPSPWADPAMVAAALDIGRALGRQRIAAAVLVGAFALGILLNRPPRNPDS